MAETETTTTSKGLKPLTQRDIAALTEYFGRLPAAIAGQITQNYDPKGGGSPAVCACTNDCDCPVRLEEQEARVFEAGEERFFLTMRRRLHAAGKADAWNVLRAYFTPDPHERSRTDWGDDTRLLREARNLGPMTPLLEWSGIARVHADALLYRDRLAYLDRWARQTHLPPWLRKDGGTPREGMRELREWSPMAMAAAVLKLDAETDQEPPPDHVDAAARELLVRACGKGHREKPGLSRKKGPRGGPEQKLLADVRLELKNEVFARAADAYRREREKLRDEEVLEKAAKKTRADAAGAELRERLREAKDGKVRGAVVNVTRLLKEALGW